MGQQSPIFLLKVKITKLEIFRGVKRISNGDSDDIQTLYHGTVHITYQTWQPYMFLNVWV
jgi:hypothetical protein